MIYALIAISLTALTLIIGLVLMTRGGELNRKFSSKLMFLRVIFQGVAILILAVVHFFSQHSN